MVSQSWWKQGIQEWCDILVDSGHSTNVFAILIFQNCISSSVQMHKYTYICIYKHMQLEVIYNAGGSFLNKHNP